MLRAVLLVMALLLTGSIADAKPPSSDYLSIVPRDWTLLPDNPETHERRFVSPSGDAWLALYARPPTRDIEAHLEGVRNHENERITYERRGRAWIVVSGYKGDRNFTEKLCWPAAVGLGITSHSNILQSKSELLINSSRALHMRCRYIIRSDAPIA